MKKLSECFLCGEGNRKRKNGLLRVHLQCLIEFQQTSDSIKIIQDFMKGYRPKHEYGYKTIEEYLAGVKAFSEKCKKLDILRAERANSIGRK